MEIRSVAGLSISESSERTIEGYAIVFNKRSVVMEDWDGNKFEEIILPSAVTQDLIDRSDIKALFEHDRYRLLARSNKGQGTLTLTIDDNGLKFRFDAPNTVDGDTALELIKRGDVAGCSFAFTLEKGGSSLTKEGDTFLRTITKFSRLYDVTVTSDPAYQDTKVAVGELRSLTAPQYEPDEEKRAKELEREKLSLECRMMEMRIRNLLS